MGSTFHGVYACSGQKAISRNGVSSHHVGSREHTQVPRLDGQCILPPPLSLCIQGDYVAQANPELRL